VRKPPANLRAWDCYHLGIFHFYKFTAEGNLEAQRQLKRSTELDSGFGEAYAWWAYAVVLGMIYWDTEPEEALLDEVLTATKRALEIDDQNAVFYVLKARIHLARCEYSAALSNNEAAIRLNSTFAVAYCALGDSLAYEGRYDEAIGQFEKAISLSPNDPQRWAFLTYGSLAMIFKRDFDSALEWAERASVVPNCQYWTTAHMAVALAHLDRHEEAGRTIAKLLVEKPGFSRAFAKRKLFYIKRSEQLELYLDGLRKAGLPE
jgi:tetratricopeptide (TPR) repeat protein